MYFRKSGRLRCDDKRKSPTFRRKIDHQQTLQGQAVEKLKLLSHAAAAAAAAFPSLIFLRK